MNLDRALAIAVGAHAGQKDPVGQPYILHPLRVMHAVATDDERVVAVLHDVVEDSAVTLEDLRRAGFAATVIEAVDALTRRHGETYEAYVGRTAAIALARRVKVADLDDNMALRRVWGLERRDAERMARYRRAYRTLTGRQAPGA